MSLQRPWSGYHQGSLNLNMEGRLYFCLIFMVSFFRSFSMWWRLSFFFFPSGSGPTFRFWYSQGLGFSLSILFQRPLVSHSFTFLFGESHLSPPFFPCDFAGSESHKVVFLTITSARQVSEPDALSCKEPCLVFYMDKVLLISRTSFLPKVVSAFQLNQDTK